MRQSPPALCDTLIPVDGAMEECGMHLRMMVTRSPLAAYDELVVVRCPFHINRGDGVLPEASDIQSEGV